MRRLALTALLTLSAGLASAAPFPFAERHDLDSGDYRGLATLTVTNPTVTSGARFEVDIRFLNTGRSNDFFNAQLDRSVFRLPARLALYDSAKQYLGDLLAPSSGSRKENITSASWTHILSNRSIGYIAKVRASADGFRPLPPGNYYLQMIYLQPFIAPNPANPSAPGEAARLQKFYQDFKEDELFRSNIVPITVVPKTHAA